jgi:hypothetical protein
MELIKYDPLAADGVCSVQLSMNHSVTLATWGREYPNWLFWIKTVYGVVHLLFFTSFYALKSELVLITIFRSPNDWKGK